MFKIQDIAKHQGVNKAIEMIGPERTEARPEMRRLHPRFTVCTLCDFIRFISESPFSFSADTLGGVKCLQTRDARSLEKRASHRGSVSCDLISTSQRASQDAGPRDRRTKQSGPRTAADKDLVHQPETMKTYGATLHLRRSAPIMDRRGNGFRNPCPSHYGGAPLKESSTACSLPAGRVSNEEINHLERRTRFLSRGEVTDLWKITPGRART
ncbi:hypothetical protein AAFF_G00275480 [Aldrovandia affinis]|uniref:Uncharacterized protein n=1 Tax=Aldrovandia affinis TaxID=143900 RepID=A0AAD7STV3_9TELE|nr:hypothetical protein AAFF_G00275480 [Aldrovandia affinis]